VHLGRRIAAWTESPSLLALLVAGTPTFFVPLDDWLGLPLVRPPRVLFAVLALLFAARALFAADTLKKPGSVEKAMASYFAIVIVSWLTTLDLKSAALIKREGAMLLDHVLVPFCVYFFARQVRWTSLRIVTVVFLLVFVVGLYLGLTAILQELFGWSFAPQRVVVTHTARATGTFSNSIEFGVVLTIVVLLTLFAALRSSAAATRAALLATAAVILVGVIFCKARALWLTTPLALFIVCRPRPALVRFVGAALFLAAAIAVPLNRVAVPRFSPFEDASFSARATDLPSLRARLAANLVAIDMAVHKPLLGFGFGIETFAQNKAAYHPEWLIPRPWAAFPTVPHNTYLHVLLMTGLIGLAAYVWLGYGLWARIESSLEQRALADTAELAPFVRAAFVLVLLNALAVDLIFFSYVVLLLLFLIGMLEPQATEINAHDSSTHDS